MPQKAYLNLCEKQIYKSDGFLKGVFFYIKQRIMGNLMLVNYKPSVLLFTEYLKLSSIQQKKINRKLSQLLNKMKFFNQTYTKPNSLNKNAQYSIVQDEEKSKQRKQYLAVFQEARHINSQQNVQNHSQDDKKAQITIKIKNTVKLMNQPQNLSLFQINKCFILLGSLISVNQHQIYNLEVKKNFLNKICQFLHQFVQEENKNQFVEDQCKIALLHTFLYIVVISISSKAKLGPQSSFKNKLFKDKRILSAFLSLKISKERNMGKLFGITVIHIVKQNLSKKFEQKLMNSILTNFSCINHQKTQLNMLMILKQFKNKYSIHSSLIKDGQIIKKLKSVFLTSKNYHQSFNALDLLLHLKSKFPVFSKQILQSQIVFKITDIQNSSFISTNNFTTQISLRYLKESAAFVSQTSLGNIIAQNLSVINQNFCEKNSQNYKKLSLKSVHLALVITQTLMPNLKSESGLFKVFNQPILEILMKAFLEGNLQIQEISLSCISHFLNRLASINQNLGFRLRQWIQTQISQNYQKKQSAGINLNLRAFSIIAQVSEERLNIE